MHIVVGLGNPGLEYSRTRHNAGFMFIDKLAEKIGAEQWTYVNKFKADATSAFYNNEKIILIKPTTYMNLSGISVEKAVEYYKLRTENITVAFDDIDIALGKFRIRPGGKSGTHNGVRSIKQSLQGRGIDFRRIRLGIDTQSEADYHRDLSAFVLARMGKDEMTIMNKTIDDAIEATLFMLEHGVEKAMQAHNKK